MRRKKRGELPRMILDREMCLRVAEGDEDAALPHHPYYCPTCCKNPSTFSAKLWNERGRTPVCEDHDPPERMEPRP